MEEKINFLLHVKLFSLRRNHLASLSLNQLKEVLFHTKWLLCMPNSLAQIAADINQVTINDIADYYANKGVQLDEELEGAFNEEKQW